MSQLNSPYSNQFQSPFPAYPFVDPGEISKQMMDINLPGTDGGQPGGNWDPNQLGPGVSAASALYRKALDADGRGLQPIIQGIPAAGPDPYLPVDWDPSIIGSGGGTDGGLPGGNYDPSQQPYGPDIPANIRPGGPLDGVDDWPSREVRRQIRLAEDRKKDKQDANRVGGPGVGTGPGGGRVGGPGGGTGTGGGRVGGPGGGTGTGGGTGGGRGGGRVGGTGGGTGGGRGGGRVGGTGGGTGGGWGGGTGTGTGQTPLQEWLTRTGNTGGTLPPIFPSGQGGGLLNPNIPNISVDRNQPVNQGEVTGDGGGSNDILDRLITEVGDADTESNEANEQRYNDILEQYLAQLTGANQTLDETDAGLGEAENIMSDRWSNVGSALEAGEGDLESRFKDTQGRLDTSEDALEDILAGLGDQDREDIDRRYAGLSAKSIQDGISRGLDNTSIRNTMARGIMEDKDRAHRSLSRDLARERVGLGTQAIGRQLGLDTLGLGQSENAINRRSTYGVQGQQFGENTIGRQLAQDQQRLAVPANLSTGMLEFMERRTDQGPDLNQLINLALQYGTFGSGDFRPRNIGNQYTTNPNAPTGGPTSR